MLGITGRWLREKYNRYLKEGDIGLIHKNRGKPSTRRWNSKELAFSINLLKTDWMGFGPTFASENLKQIYNINVTRETLRKAMLANGIDYNKRKKGNKEDAANGRRYLDLMVQLDGSPHDWFEGRGPKCTLLVFIDDATSQFLWLEFAESESVISVMKATKQYFTKFGKPVSFYVDYGSVFSVNTNNKERIKKSQYERAMSELGVEIIHARSPQAKGRVERCNRTMQEQANQGNAIG